MSSINDLLPAPEHGGKADPRLDLFPASSNAGSKSLAVQFALQSSTSSVPKSRRNHGLEALIPVSRSELGSKLDRPSKEIVAETCERTRLALKAILDAQIAGEPAYREPLTVEYVPATAGIASVRPRVLKIVDAQLDPFEPPRHRHVRAPPAPTEAPAPKLSAPTKPTPEEARSWKIPASVSNWKNRNGFIIPVSERVAGQQLAAVPSEPSQRVTELAQVLRNAEATARRELAERAAAREEAEQAEREAREKRLRDIALRARRFDRNFVERERDVAERAALGQAPMRSDEQVQFDPRLYARGSQPVSAKDLYDRSMFDDKQRARRPYAPKVESVSVSVPRQLQFEYDNESN